MVKAVRADALAARAAQVREAEECKRIRLLSPSFSLSQSTSTSQSYLAVFLVCFTGR
jgi:hypothetical protein